MFELPCTHKDCQGTHEVFCPFCNGSVELFEKVGPMYYCECHKCQKVCWVSHNETISPYDFPMTKVSKYEKFDDIVGEQ